MILALLELFSIAEVNEQILKTATLSEFTDFEDAVLYQAACHAGVDGLVTRNGNDFKTAERPVYAPDELWHIIQSQAIAT